MKNLIMALMLLITSTTSFALVKERDGGDSMGLTQAQIEKYIKGNLADDVKDLLQVLNINSIGNKFVKEIVLELLKKDLDKLILKQQYKIMPGKCIDRFGDKRGSTSGHNDFGGMVCFDSEILEKRGTTKSSLIALTIHEYAHHVGYLDKDNVVGSFFTNFIDFSNKPRVDIPKISDKNEYIINHKVYSLPLIQAQRKAITQILLQTHKEASASKGAKKHYKRFISAHLIKQLEDHSDIKIEKVEFSCVQDSIEDCKNQFNDLLEQDFLVIDLKIDCHFSGWWNNKKCEGTTRYLDKQFLTKKEKWVTY